MSIADSCASLGARSRGQDHATMTFMVGAGFRRSDLETGSRPHRWGFSTTMRAHNKMDSVEDMRTLTDEAVA